MIGDMEMWWVESLLKKLDFFHEWEAMQVVTQLEGFTTYESIINWR